MKKTDKPLEFHPVSEPYPMIGGHGWALGEDGRPFILNAEESDSWQRFKRSIRMHGLQQPITLWDGKIVDGRNRYIACLETDTKPRFVNIEDTVPGWAKLSAEARWQKARDVAFANNKERTQYTTSMVALMAIMAYGDEELERAQADETYYAENHNDSQYDRTHNNANRRAIRALAERSGASEGTVQRCWTALRGAEESGEPDPLSTLVEDLDKPAKARKGIKRIEEEIREKRRAAKLAEEKGITDRAEKGRVEAQQTKINPELDAASRSISSAATALDNAAKLMLQYGWDHMDLSRKDKLALALDKLQTAIDALPWGEEEE